MDFFQYATDALLKIAGAENLAPIINLLKANDFNLSKTVSELSPDTVLPVIKEFIAASSKNDYSPPQGSFGTAPVSGFADKKIVSLLNDCLSRP